MASFALADIAGALGTALRAVLLVDLLAVLEVALGADFVVVVFLASVAMYTLHSLIFLTDTPEKALAFAFIIGFAL
jgi:hypothetical protein